MRRQQKHAYDPHEIESLKRIPVPAKIKCGRCSKNLPNVKYSTKQLTDYRYQIKTQGRIVKSINCHGCTGGAQIVEIECTMCHKTKALEDFAKSQKAKPDTAKCFKCIDEQVKQKPIDHARYAAGNKPFLIPDTVNGHMPDYFSSADSTTDSEVAAAWADFTSEGRSETDALSSNMRAMSVKGSDTGVLIGSEFATSGGYQTDREDGQASWHTRSSGPTSTSNGGSQRTFASSIAERSSVRPGAFPKIRAYQSPPMLPHGDAEREMKEAWASEDGSSESEVDDNDDDSDGENTII